jgi:hypothetical protein
MEELSAVQFRSLLAGGTLLLISSPEQFDSAN